MRRARSGALKRDKRTIEALDFLSGDALHDRINAFDDVDMIESAIAVQSGPRGLVRVRHRAPRDSAVHALSARGAVFVDTERVELRGRERPRFGVLGLLYGSVVTDHEKIDGLVDALRTTNTASIATARARFERELDVHRVVATHELAEPWRPGPLRGWLTTRR